MKTLLAIAATALVSLVVPQTAEAGHSSGYTYQSGRSSCGCPVYTRRVVCSYDCYNRPIYRYYSVPVVHRCSHSRGHSSYSHYTPSRHSYHDSYHRGRSHYSSSHRGYSRGNSRGCR